MRFVVCFAVWISVIVAAYLPADAQTPFASGSTGAQGVFPPPAFTGSSGYNAFVLDLKTGAVNAVNSAGTVILNTTLPGGASSGDAFATGELNFTTFFLEPNVALRFVANTLNTPITILTSGNVTIAGTIDIKGTGGALISSSGITPGGKGGPGGFAGGAGGTPAITGRPETTGRQGLGKGGGIGGLITPIDPLATHGQGGKFPHSNPVIIPLIGGSGGGGGRGSKLNGDTNGGGGGGGGGGAILIASSGEIILSGTISAVGGTGGGGPATTCTDCGKGGGGGSGGAIRLIANRLNLTGGLRADPGPEGMTQGGEYGRGGAGMIRLEAHDIVPNAVSVPPATLGPPGIIRPPTIPTLRLSSIGGVTVPDVSAGNPEVTLPSGASAPANPMAVVVTASLVPNGTTIKLVLKVPDGDPSVFESEGNLANGSVTFNVTIPPGVSYLQAVSAQFTVSAELQRELPLFKGEKIRTASVDFDGAHSQTYFYTESGIRVSAEELLGLQ